MFRFGVNKRRLGSGFGTLAGVAIAPPATHAHTRETDRGHNDGCDSGFSLKRCEELCTRRAKAMGMCQCRREERDRA